MPDSFVLYYQGTDGPADIIYVGTDKAEALDTLLEFGKKTWCEVANIKLVTQSKILRPE